MPYRDEFDDLNKDRNITSTLEAVRRQVFLKTRGPAVAAGVLVFAAVVLAAVVFFTYPADDKEAQDSVPLIQADARPFRVAPDDPGGMDIPHRDSTVFSTLRSSGLPDDTGVENLLADDTTEEPMPRSQLFAGLNTEDGQDESTIEPSASTEELLNQGTEGSEDLFADTNAAQQQVEDKFSAQDSVAGEPAKPVDSSTAVDSDAEKLAAIREEPLAKPAEKIVPSGTHYVQLGAVQSADAAEKGWSSFQKEFAQLSGMDHRVQRADLGGKGIYYRIQAGPLGKEEAAALCAAIKAQKPGGCLVVGQ